MALSKTTQDHDEIRQWAEKRGGKPAEVGGTETKGGPGILRIEFPGATNANDSNLNEISWDEFFEKFDQSGLALVYQEVTKEGAESNFNKLVKPENASGGTGKSGAKKAATKAPAKTAAKKSAATAPGKSAEKTAPSAKKAAVTKTSATKTAAQKTSAKKAPAKSAAPTGQTVVAKKTAAAKKPASPVAKGTTAKRK